MDDSDSMYDTVIGAIQVIHDVFSASDRRMKAQLYLDQFKDQLQPDRALAYAVKLINKANDQRVRHFGLQVTEHIINRHWNSFNADTKSSVSNMLIQYISNVRGWHIGSFIIIDIIFMFVSNSE